MKNNKYKCPICGSNICIESKVTTTTKEYDDYNDEYVTSTIDMALPDIHRKSYSDIRYKGHGICDWLGTGIEDRKYTFKENESSSPKVKAYVCKKCGHIELFVDPINFFENEDESVEMVKKCSIAMKEYEQWLKDANKYVSLYKKYNSYSKLINNPDKTLREINEAKEELKLIDKQSVDKKMKELFERIKAFIKKYESLQKYNEPTFIKVYKDMINKLDYWKKNVLK